MLVRSAVAEAPGGTEAFTGAVDVDAETLDRICTGALRPTVGELAALLERARTGLRVRLEVYDDHDDGLHLRAAIDPERHHRIRAQAEDIFARAQPGLQR